MSDPKFTGTPKKATTHVNQNEGLIFEEPSPPELADFHTAVDSEDPVNRKFATDCMSATYGDH